MRLGIDLDGVVADFNSGWIRFYNRDFDAGVTEDRVTHWNIIPDLTHFATMDEFWEWSLDLDGATLFRHLDPYPGTIEVAKRLAASHDLVVITAKPASARADTMEWLIEHEFPTDEVHIVGIHSPAAKPKVLADAYLDDGPYVLPHLIAERPEAAIHRFVRPWNDPVPGAIDVHDWDEFEASIDRLNGSREDGFRR